jgi:hypothetical protein
MNVKLFLCFVFISVVSVASPASAQEDGDLFWYNYFELKYIADGPAEPGVSNYSELWGNYAVYSDVSHEVGVGGRWRIDEWPLSVGGEFLFQDGSWRSENEYELGYTLQLKWGRGEEIQCDAEGNCRNTFWDFAIRHATLIDLTEGDVGRSTLLATFIKEWGMATHFQLIPSLNFFYFGSDSLPEYEQGHQFQLTGSVEASIHWLAWKYICPLLFLEAANTWTLPDDSRGVFTPNVGIKGEFRWDPVTLWYTARGGPQVFFGDFQRDYGWDIMFSLGLLFK